MSGAKGMANFVNQKQRINKRDIDDTPISVAMAVTTKPDVALPSTAP
jgi:hypothetical protein